MPPLSDGIPSQKQQAQERSTSVIKVHRIITGTTLLAVCGLMMIVLAQEKPQPPLTQAASTNSIKAVKLRLTFESGDSANVTEFEGGTIKVEKDGNKLTITPYIREQGKVELRVSQAVQRGGREVMEAVATLLADKGLTKLNRGNLPFSVQVLDTEKKLSSAALAAGGGGTCCARTCNGTLICGSCVCTDCGVCSTFPWCECAMP
jgi:hypothetical protein